MSDKKKRRETFDMSSLEHSLLSSSPSLSAEDRAEIVNALKNKRVEFLKEIQSQYDELEAKFSEERAALEAKYQKLYQPFYEKRFEIVNGVVEVECDSDETAADSAMDNTADDEKGVPDFWLTAMKSNEELAEEIQERDEAALKFLKDIKCRTMDNPKGFKLEFFFDTNPFFKNSVLTKKYHVVGDDKASIGTEIEWNPGQNLTRKILEKKPKRRSKNKKTTTRTEDCQSFFNFFSPPVLPDDVDLLDVETAQKLLYQIEDDYGIGAIIRDKIIPHAVSWFTGEGHSWRRGSG